MVLTVLSVAEKPSVAKELAKIISGGENFERRNGKSQYNPIYILRDCPFKGSKCTMKITSVTGHMMEIDFEERYKSWTGCNAIDLFEAPIRKQVKKESENIEKTLRDESNSCNVLLLWLDCDLEGENISFEVIDVCKKANPRLEVYRARFSALIHRDIMRTLNNPDRPNQQQSDAVEARQEIDLRLGAAFTRFQSLRLQNRFPQLQSKVISYGPCQFPTLGFVADRYIKIKEFRPEEFWSISFSFEGVSVDGDRCFCDFAWRRHRVFDRFTCAILYESCFTQNSSSNEMQVVAQIKAVDASPTSRFKPLPLNTIELQKRASRFLSMSSEHTMKIAEELYQRGILSYPRTETDYFKDGIDLKGLLEEHRGHDQWGEYCARLLDGTSTSNHFEWPRKGGHDDQAHPPIHPTKCVNSNELKSNDEKKLYDLVCRHFFACCSMDAKGAKTNVSIQIKNCDECFSTTGLMVLERNWLEIYPFERWNGSKLPKFSVGQEIIPTVFIMKSGRTCPPPLLNESDLIAEMDRCGIGTDATIAEHISKILTRDYATKISTSLPSLPSLEGINEGDRDLDGSDDELVDRRPQPPDNRNQPVSNNRSSHGMYFSPTPLGLALVEGYNSMGYQLTKPFLRASMELDCKRVARGEVSKDVVVRHCMEDMKKCFETVVREATRLDSAMSKYFGYSSNGDSFGNRRNGYNGLPIDQNTYSLSQSRFSKCGTCQQLMDLKVEVQSNAQHHNPNNSLPKKILVCSSCSKTLFLPIRGELKAVNQTCVICNYQVISILNIETQKSHHVCPFCFKNPPPPPVGDSELNEFRCFNCAKSSCPLSGLIPGGKDPVCPCPSLTCSEYLMAKKTPKGFLLSCSNKDCKGSFWFPRCVLGVSVLSETCKRCWENYGVSLRNISLEMSPDTLPLGLPASLSLCPGCHDHQIWRLLDHPPLNIGLKLGKLASHSSASYTSVANSGVTGSVNYSTGSFGSTSNLSNYGHAVAGTGNRSFSSSNDSVGRGNTTVSRNGIQNNHSGVRSENNNNFRFNNYRK